MSISITYVARRDEVWRMYWRQWRLGLWKLHVVIFAAAAFSVSLALYGGAPTRVSDFIQVGAIALAPLVFAALFPMLMFKPQTRVLTVDQHGLSTTIGRRSGTAPWADIANVREQGDALVIQRRNLNAFVVPARAFSSAEARSQFRAFVDAQVAACNRRA